MSKKSKKQDKKETEISISVDIEVSKETKEEGVEKSHFFRALDKVIESGKKQDSEDS